jgi:putative endonuclease
MQFFYIYVLQSKIDKNFYVGYTNDVKRRLDEHNSGQVDSTKYRKPLKLIYWEGCLNRNDAISRKI